MADPGKSYTRALARYVLDLSKNMTMLTVANHLGVYWDMVKAILKSDLERKAKRRSWRKVHGYRDVEFFILRLLFLHETKINLAGS